MKKLFVVALALAMSLGTWGEAQAVRPRWTIDHVNVEGRAISFSVNKNGVWQGRVQVRFSSDGSFPSNMKTIIATP